MYSVLPVATFPKRLRGLWRRESLALSLPVVCLLFLIQVAIPTKAQTRAYVANQCSNDVSVIDTATNIVGATIPVGVSPFGVAITPDGTRGYVANITSNNVSVFDTATNTVVATIPVGTSPDAVGITPDGTRAYVVNEISNNVSVIDTATNSVVATIPVGMNPAGVAITPGGNHNHWNDDNERGEDRDEDKDDDDDKDRNNNSARAYVTNGTDGTVSVIDVATNTVVATIPVEMIPFGVAITPDGTQAYVANIGSDNVSVIEIATNAVVATIPVGVDPVGIAISTDGARVYVTNNGSNTASVIDPSTNTVVATIPVDVNPIGVAITPNGARVYIANGTSNTVSVIDTPTNAVVETIAVGACPFGVAITPAPQVTPFSTFKPQAVIGPRHHTFTVVGRFRLGADSDGIAPLTEAVQLQLGTFSATIPAGSFKKERAQRYTFFGTLNGVKLAIAIQRTGRRKYTFAVIGTKANLAGTTNPVTVKLTIGNDTGSASIQALFL